MRSSAGPGGPGAAAPAWQAYPVLWIPLRGGRYDIGPLDLLLFTTIGEHWCPLFPVVTGPRAESLLAPRRLSAQLRPADRGCSAHHQPTAQRP